MRDGYAWKLDNAHRTNQPQKRAWIQFVFYTKHGPEHTCGG
jgi:hypothetical protein